MVESGFISSSSVKYIRIPRLEGIFVYGGLCVCVFKFCLCLLLWGILVVFGRLFVFTLGFHEDFAIRRLTSSAAGRSDAIICVTIKPIASATHRAYGNLVSFAQVNGVNVLGLLDIDPGDPASAIASIVSTFNSM